MNANHPKPNPELVAKTMRRIKAETEAALGGIATPVLVADLALYIQYGTDGMLDIGGQIPKHLIPETLHKMADMLATRPQFQESAE